MELENCHVMNKIYEDEIFPEDLSKSIFITLQRNQKW